MAASVWASHCPLGVPVRYFSRINAVCISVARSGSMPRWPCGAWEVFFDLCEDFECPAVGARWVRLAKSGVAESAATIKSDCQARAENMYKTSKINIGRNDAKINRWHCEQPNGEGAGMQQKNTGSGYGLGAGIHLDSLNATFPRRSCCRPWGAADRRVRRPRRLRV